MVDNLGETMFQRLFFGSVKERGGSRVDQFDVALIVGNQNAVGH